MAKLVLASSMKPHRFPVLDGLRGVAAIIVVTLHNPQLFGRLWFPRGYLAVDFFFMLSGFVIARAYQERLDHGWSTWTFMKVRLIRLYPLYALGLALGVIDSGISIFTGRVYGKAGMITAAVLNAFLLPALFTASNREYFPFNMPSWSLFMEIVMNLLHALLLRNRTRRFLMAVLICSGLGFAVSSVYKGTTDVGIGGMYGFTRLIFSYVLGMLLLHLWKTRHWRLRMPMIVLPILLAGPMTLSGAHPLVVTNLLMIALVFPVVVLAAAECQPRSNTLLVATYLGSASYAIYILHSPVIPLIQIVWNRLFRADMYRYAPWSGFAYLGIVIAAAAVVDIFYDAPARKFLTRKMIAATTRA